MFFRIIRSTLWVFITPLLAGVSIAFYNYINGMNFVFYSQRLFVYGAISFLVLHALLYSRQGGKGDLFTRAWSWLYVFAHEVMHGLTAILCGGKFSSLRITSRGGSVRTTKSNILISLAPYLVPFYTLIIILVYLILNLIFGKGAFRNEFIFLVGFTITFHVVLTVDFLKTHQPDLKQTGTLWSISIIYLVNLLLVTLILCGLFKLGPVTGVFKEALSITQEFYLKIIDLVWGGVA